jgi:2-iminobutanoate/2-iminopropanoate deaminase
LPTSIRTISTPKAFSSPVLSQGMQLGNLLFVSGQVGLDPESATAPAELQDEINLAIDGLESVLRAAGCGLESVVKTTCYLSDINDLSLCNDIYMERFQAPRPARTTIQATLAMGLRFEIEAIAVLEQ